MRSARRGLAQTSLRTVCEPVDHSHVAAAAETTASGPPAGQIERDVDRSAVDVLSHRKPTALEDPQHRLIARKYLRVETRNIEYACDADEMREQAPRDAQPLIILFHDEGDLFRRIPVDRDNAGWSHLSRTGVAPAADY